jgi:hypothetical protein
MTPLRRRLLVSALLCAACAAPLPAAGAAGPPLPSSASGRAGAVAPGGSERLLTRRVGYDTVVTAVRRRDLQVLRSRQIDGRWSVSPVTVNGATTGLSADGRVLVLARPERSFPPASTALAVLDAKRLVVRRLVALAGFFTVDAISPDGHWLYLIQYPGQDLLDYRVRALDTRTGQLAARDVVDPREPDEQMGGLPMARVMSRDGRFAYTLYSGGEETFIHALDTVSQSAACIDLAELPPDTDLSGFRLDVSADGRRVRVLSQGSVVSSVDARTGALSERVEAAATQPEAPDAASHAATQPDDEAGFPWLPVVLAAGLAGLVLAAAFARRRGRRQPAAAGGATSSTTS